MNTPAAPLTGDASRRVHGARLALEQRAATAIEKARAAQAEGDVYFAAALRGKAAAYSEAVELIHRVERGRRLRKHKITKPSGLWKGRVRP